MKEKVAPSAPRRHNTSPNLPTREVAPARTWRLAAEPMPHFSVHHERGATWEKQTYPVGVSPVPLTGLWQPAGAAGGGTAPMPRTVAPTISNEPWR